MRRYISLFFAFCLLISIAPTSLGAVDPAAVSAGCETAIPGSNVIVCIDASNFADIAGMTLSVYYDADALRTVNVTTGELLSAAINSVNSSTPGEIVLSVVTQYAICGNGTLLMIEFQVSGDCEAGSYPITIAVGEAYTTSLQITSISSSSGSVTVDAGSDAPQTFEIWNYTDNNYIHYGNSFNYCVVNEYSLSFASCDFVVEYDPDALRFDSVKLSDELTVEGAVYSINAHTPGVLRISYASDTTVNSYSLFSVKFSVYPGEDTETTITARAQNIYGEDLIAYYPSFCNVSVTLLCQPAVVNYPDAYLASEMFIVGEECISHFVLEEGAGVAAADFVLNYDPSVLQCVSVKAASGVSASGGMVVINDNYFSGEIRFSYINTKGYDDTDIPLITITWIPVSSPDQHYEIHSSGTGIVDLNYVSLTLDHQVDSACIYRKTVLEATCETGSSTEYTCGCGDSIVTDQVTALGHTFSDYSVDSNGVKTAVCGRQGCDETLILTPVSLEITTLPEKRTYHLSEELDLTGMTVTVFYDDGSSEAVNAYEISVYRVSYSDHTVTVIYGRCQASFVVHVLGYGDCNGDGTVDALDLAWLRNYLAGRDPVTGVSAVEIGSGADFNADGVINGVDLAILRAYLTNVDQKE